MGSGFWFWSACTVLICWVLISRILRGNKIRAKSFIAVNKVERYVGIMMLVLFLFGIAFAIFVGFPE